MTYVHPELGFEIELPAGAEIREDIAGIAVAAIDPDPEPVSRFRPNLTVTVEPVPPGAEVDAYTDASLATQDRVLAMHRLLDRTATTLRGGSATRTLAHHAQQGQALTIEQWRLVAGQMAYTVTASCATLDYAAVADSFAEAAESLSPAG
jgi:hypothetical protein